MASIAPRPGDRGIGYNFFQPPLDFLNALNQQGTNEARLENEQFPIPDTTQFLPEDFLVRGQVWTQLYHPDKFFAHCAVDDEEHFLEPPSITVFAQSDVNGSDIVWHL
ncbi:hypothetical protein AJ80_09849 [Polytolypa hystricis UAMH7299]|uniref:Uncharacterized protein n=1 Tax=Polytolypa hystricis (strain UAMH7299) TaxID=1447883 RepID=A0A2B7WIF4_POLH7|nr:hypothetical protein AJ80_09849 [Polytolypa hystricis UAMH7299]